MGSGAWRARAVRGKAVGDPEPISPFLLSTDAFPVRERLAMWREMYGRNIINGEIEPLDDRPFYASVSIHALPGVGVAFGSRSDASLFVDQRCAAKMSDRIALTLVTRGVGHASQFGREATAGPGGAIPFSTIDAFSATLRGDGAHVTLSFPRAAVQALAPGFADAMARPINPGNGALRLLADYLGVLRDRDAPLKADLASVFSGHLLDLTALVIGARGEVRESALAGGAKAAWRRAILREIGARATTPSLSAKAIARNLGISTRYLHAILEETGKSFSEIVLERRLAQASSVLNDRRFDGLTISEIALAAGFSDISYFNRSFRRRFGDTPSKVRAGLICRRATRAIRAPRRLFAVGQSLCVPGQDRRFFAR